MSVANTQEQKGKKRKRDLLDDLEAAVLEILRAVFEVLGHSSLYLMRSVISITS